MAQTRTAWTMTRQGKRLFLLLVASQAAHSVEEIVGALYDVFAPARFVSSLVSDDLRLGFLVVNGAIVLFGLWCFWWPVRGGWASARGLAWLWAAVELANGLGHGMLALARKGYFPGVATAPLLVVVALWLAIVLAGRRSRSADGPVARALLVLLGSALLLGGCGEERSLVVTATAYNSVPSQTSGNPTVAAWGDELRPGMRVIAVSPDLLELGLSRGTRVEIEGLPGTFEVLDKTSSRLRNTIDIYMGKDVRRAQQWGRRTVRITWPVDGESGGE